MSNKTEYPYIELSQGYQDERGLIQPLVEEGFTALQVITSKKDSVRANHFHKTGSHYMYVISGVMRYYYRPVGEEGGPEYVDVNPGQIVHTPSMVEHAAHFLEDCTFLNITTDKREQSAYEADTTRVDLFSLNDA